MSNEVAQGIPFEEGRLKRSWEAVRRAGEAMVRQMQGDHTLQPWERFMIQAYGYMPEASALAPAAEAQQKSETSAAASLVQDIGIRSHGFTFGLGF